MSDPLAELHLDNWLCIIASESYLSWPDHVVGGDWWLDHFHQNVSVALLTVLDAFEEGPAQENNFNIYNRQRLPTD